LERAAWLERRFGAQIEWRPFDLHPEYPPEGIPRSVLEQRYGTGFSDRLSAMFEQAGLPHAATLNKVPNSRRALMLGELARDRERLDSLHPRLFDAYWARGLDIGDDQVLIEEGVAAGLDATEVIDALQDDRYLGRIEADTNAALQIGAGGVPAWLIDQRLLVPGAQPHELFERVLERLGHLPGDRVPDQRPDEEA
jgi:predicted DsbA family dithiol-disulfide isomerase